MPKYQVLRPIEHDQKLYLPADHPEKPETAASVSHGRPVPVDSTGMIEVTEQEAAGFDPLMGQIQKVEERVEPKKKK